MRELCADRWRNSTSYSSDGSVYSFFVGWGGPGHPPPEKPQDMEQVVQVKWKGEVTCNLSSRMHTSALRSSPSPEETPALVFSVLSGVPKVLKKST